MKLFNTLNCDQLGKRWDSTVGNDDDVIDEDHVLWQVGKVPLLAPVWQEDVQAALLPVGPLEIWDWLDDGPVPAVTVIKLGTKKSNKK